jgi:hypothetical protein
MLVEAQQTSEILAVAVRPPVQEFERQVGPSGAANGAAPENDAKPSRAEGGHAVTRDKADRDRIKPTIFAYLSYAQKKSGRRPLEMALEFLRLNRGCGKLT